MSSFCTRKVQQQFSTTQLTENRSYSTRYSKNRQKKCQYPSLPYLQQRSAITIQRWWRFRMAMRRLYYEHLLEELYYENQAMGAIVKIKENMVEGIQRQQKYVEELSNVLVERAVRKDRQALKRFSKECVAVVFKMEKKMVDKEELERASQQRTAMIQRIAELKEKKMKLQELIIQDSSKCEQKYLRQIKQANSQLLKIVSQRNSIKQKLKQQKIDKQQLTT